MRDVCSCCVEYSIVCVTGSVMGLVMVWGLNRPLCPSLRYPDWSECIHYCHITAQILLKMTATLIQMEAEISQVISLAQMLKSRVR